MIDSHTKGSELERYLVKAKLLGLCKILPLPILHGMHCNKGWSGANTVLRNRVGDEGGEWGVQT